ncbi:MULTISPECIES: hypothetical protein [unclassified Pseudomonas]|uniref:hypothetical protein n=1 Tax=unclassified Pseudomonas TaxID=196821 RepID=UPI003FA34758
MVLMCALHSWLTNHEKVQDVKRPEVAGLTEKLACKPAGANNALGMLREMFHLTEVGLPLGRHEPVPHFPMHPSGEVTWLIVGDELALIFRQLEKLETKGLEKYVIQPAICL